MKPQVNLTAYTPLNIDLSDVSSELLDVIPFENKLSMNFPSFKQETPDQIELMQISKQFCHHVMHNESILVILTGRAGIGKTASAVCAAKELSARRKKVVWISEVTVSGWAAKANSIADLNNCEREIDNLLSGNPDVVFLDDDNLSGFCGEILLEKIYKWYVTMPGKGLFITSNGTITFENCYGEKLDGRYHYPPFCDYHSVQYLNWQERTGLSGESLRTRRDGQSIGAIVSTSAYQKHEASLEQFELVPAFDDNLDLVPLRQSLLETYTLGPRYAELRPIQQKWIHQFKTYKSRNLTPILSVCPKKFDKTNCKTIALELGEYISSYDGSISIDDVCMDQLVLLLNYAHDQGGRRIILINQTRFTHDELLQNIKMQLPKEELERSWSRLMLLLCETEDSIFNFNEFNGSVDDRPQINSRKQDANVVRDLALFRMSGLPRKSGHPNFMNRHMLFQHPLAPSDVKQKAYAAFIELVSTIAKNLAC